MNQTQPPSTLSHSDQPGSLGASLSLEQDIQRVQQALNDLFEYDRAVARQERPADRKQRWLLDLLLRCAQGRYEMSADPI